MKILLLGIQLPDVQLRVRKILVVRTYCTLSITSQGPFKMALNSSKTTLRLSVKKLINQLSAVLPLESCNSKLPSSAKQGVSDIFKVLVRRQFN